jgi:hypothetical protein
MVNRRIPGWRSVPAQDNAETAAVNARLGVTALGGAEVELFRRLGKLLVLATMVAAFLAVVMS